MSASFRIRHHLEDQSPSGPVNCVRFNSSGQYAMTAGNDKTVKLWNAESGKHIKTFVGHGYPVLALAITSDNARFASSGGDKQVYYWDVAASRIIRKFHGHFHRVNCLAFSHDGSVLASGSFDATVRLWDCRTNSRDPIQILKESKDSVTSVYISEHEILVGSVDGAIRVYDIRKGTMTTDMLSHPVTSASMSGDGNCILVSTLDDTIRLLDKESGEVLNEYVGHRNSKYKIESCFTNDDALVFSGSEDGQIYCWDLVEANLITTLQGHRRSVLSVDAHPGATNLLSGSSDGSVIVWEGENMINTVANEI